MATFSAARLIGGNGGDENTASVYNSRLKQYEAVLIKKDGRLSPADYDELIGMANKFMSQLKTPSQKASLKTQAADYEIAKAKLLNNKSSIGSLEKQISDGYQKASYGLINSPQQFAEARIAELTAARQSLLDSGANSDYQVDDSEYANISNQLNLWGAEILDWQDALKNNTFEAYVKADRQTGRPVQMEYVPAGMNPLTVDKSRTKLTNLTVDGIPVHTTLNLPEDGRYYNAKLFGKTLKLDKNFAIGGILSEGGMGTGEPMDIPSDSFSSSEYLPPASFVKSTNQKDTFYDKDNNTKYVQADPKILNAEDAFTVPSTWEERINQKVNKVVDFKTLPESKFYSAVPNSDFKDVSSEESAAANPSVDLKAGDAYNYSPPAMQEPQGQELANKRTEEITKGGLFKSLISSGKNFLGNYFK